MNWVVGGNPLADEEIEKRLKALKDNNLNRKIDLTAQKKLKNEEKEFKKHINAQQEHDKLIDNCIIAFNPESVCYKKTGYKFTTVEPLVERKIRNFDVLISNKDQELGIFIECKYGLSSGVSEYIDEMYEKIDVLEENLEYLEDIIGYKISRREYVCCTPSQYVDSIAREIEKRETEGKINCVNGPHLLIWGLHWWPESEVKLHNRINSPRKEHLKQHGDKHLTKLLADGIKTFNRDLPFSFYPSSHPYKHASFCVNWILRENKKKGVSLTLFDRNEPATYFKKQLPHYARDTLGQNLADRFIREGISKRLLSVSEDDREKIVINSRGKSIETIEKDYQKGYIETSVKEIAIRKANREVYIEFKKSHRSLEDFS